MTAAAYIALAVALVALAAWDTARRIIAARYELEGVARKELTALVERSEASSERNDQAIKNLIAQVVEITKYQQQEKVRAAAGTRVPRG